MGARALSDFERRIREPIIILGAGRSGTSLLASIVAAHPDVAYLGEPRPIWMHGHVGRPHHELGADDLTPRIARYIDRRFARFLEAEGRSRFAEKTPSNCLRVPFIHALYPDARFVHILRDGRDVVRSTLQIRKRATRNRKIAERLRMTPLSDWPAYLPLFLRTVWRTNVLRKPARYWGAQPRGWQAWVDLPPHEVAARQWVALTRAALRDTRALPEENRLELRYEAFVRDPQAAMVRVARFAGLPDPQPMIAEARRRIDPDRPRLWRTSLDEAREREVEAITRPVLDELGYV